MNGVEKDHARYISWVKLSETLRVCAAEGVSHKDDGTPHPQCAKESAEFFGDFGCGAREVNARTCAGAASVIEDTGTGCRGPVVEVPKIKTDLAGTGQKHDVGPRPFTHLNP